MIKRVVGYLMISLLAGCATAAQRQYQAIAANTQDAAAKMRTCTGAIYNAPEAEPLRMHLPPPDAQPTLEQLADEHTATDEEITAILLLHPRLQACRSAALDQIGRTTPTIAAILASAYTRSDEAVVTLIQKRIAWGPYNAQASELRAELRSQLTAESSRITAGLEQSHQAELARRQAAADALARYNQTQQIINSMNRPVFTNCAGGAGMVNCVSQ